MGENSRPEHVRIAIENTLNPPATGYTLPGVLFFLQSEWRKVEREKVEWELERAELKSKIAVLEGRLKLGQTQNNDLLRRVKMLEQALRSERQSQLHNTMKNDVSTDPLQANQGSSSSTSAVDLEPEPSLAVYGSTGNGSGIAVLKYSKGNGLQRTRALLTGYLEEAAALTDTNAPDLVAEFKRLRALKQSYDKVAYGTSQNKLLAMRTESPEAKEATEGKADGDREMSSPQKVEMVDLRAPIPSSELPSPSPVHPPGTERVPDDEVEDDDETLESRSGASEGTTAAPVSDNNTAMDARGTVMRKFVEYEGAKRRGVLSKIRDMRRLGSEEREQRGAQEEEPMEASPDNEEPSRARLRFALRSHLAGVRAVTWHPEDPIVFSGAEDGTAKMWNLQPSVPGRKMPIDIEPSFTFRGHTLPVLSLSVACDEEPILCTSSADSSVVMWHIPNAGRDPYASYHETKARRSALVGHTDAVWAAIAHPFYATSALLVSTGSDGTAKIWDGKLLKHSFRKETATPLCAAWLKTSPSKTAVGYDDGTVSLYDAFAGKEVASFGSGARIEGLACHPNLPLVLAACSDGTVKVYETTTANHVHTFETQFDGATAIDVNPDGLTFACGGYDAQLKIFDLSAQSIVDHLDTACRHRDEGIWSIAYAPNATLRGGRQMRGLAIGGADGIVRVYEV